MEKIPRKGRNQRKSVFLESSESNRQVRTVLFEKWELQGLNRSSKTENTFQQAVSLTDSAFFDESAKQILLSFTTPPTVKKPVVTPAAPVKQRKLRTKANLKPKKLIYTDEELEVPPYFDSSTLDSRKHLKNVVYEERTIKHSRFEESKRNTRSRTAELERFKKNDTTSSVRISRRTKLQSDNKENVSCVTQKPEKKPNTKSNAVEKECYLGFNPYADTLSQCGAELNWQEKLRWLQPRRDVGLWVECCRKNCKKFRYVEEYHDPLDVPEIWYCEMNSDKTIASCSIPEKTVPPAIESDLIENEYNAGSIVWVYIRGYPWWPAIIDDSPETFTYFKIQKNSHKPHMYHVTFFCEQKLEHIWAPCRNIKPFVRNKYSDLVKKTIFNGEDYKERLDKAHELASSAIHLTILQRLEKFSFIALYNKLYDANNNNSTSLVDNNATDVPMIVSNSTDEILPSPNGNVRTTLKDFYLRVLKRLL